MVFFHANGKSLIFRCLTINYPVYFGEGRVTGRFLSCGSDKMDCGAGMENNIENNLDKQKLDNRNISQLLSEHRYEELRQEFAEADPADVADLLDNLGSDEIEKVFAILDTETASEVIVEMDAPDRDEVVENLAPDKLAGMLSEMAPDDAVDLFNQLDEQDQSLVLHFMPPEKKDAISELAEYDQDTAGGLMTPEFCAVSANATVQQAINSIAEQVFADPVTMVFVLDNDGRLAGAIHISELISKSGRALIRDIIDAQSVIYAMVDEPATEVADKVRKYDLTVIPVVDEDFKLVGRITVDDVIDVIDDAAVEDMARMAGAPDLEQRSISPLEVVKLRLPWLLVTMMAGALVSMIVMQISSSSSIPFLAAFVPVILGMGGNTGMQATAVTVRGIAVGEIEFSKLINLFLRELLVGALMGVVCGLIVSAVVWFNIRYLSETPQDFNAFRLMAVVAISMLCAMSFAAFSGSLMPIILHKMKFDPAVASGPFVSTGNDLSASLIYLIMCKILLEG